MDLNNLAAQLKGSGQRQFSLCLYDPLGTGKTEYVRQLADQLGMEVLVKRTSDLLGSYVGETGRQIAAVFQEAQDRESFLVFDEADSLLGDRRHAHQNWEVSQVNEMLTWMESHPLPFACTTNLMDQPDQASLRRFTFKVQFDYLTFDQVKSTSKYFFQKELSINSSIFLHLTLGDFATVYRKAHLLGLLEDQDHIVRMLMQEQQVKEACKRTIGFY